MTPPDVSHDQFEVLRGIDFFVGENLTFLEDVEKIWQPTDYLPDLEGDGWREEMEAFRAAAMQISDEMLVVLVGDMVTEEALPSYAVALNLIARDEEGDAQTPWARWLRGWTAEENRHGDLLNAYLRLTGRVDMRSVEVTVQHLIAGGFNPRTKAEPYKGLIYTSFQERATRISHGNVGKLVAAEGDANLAAICRRIAGDEARHEAFYTKMMGHVLDADPAGGMTAIRELFRSVIAMPGRHMTDGKDPDLFDHFSAVAQRAGVYTVRDYATIVEHLVKTWKLADRSVTGKAARAQEWLCQHAEQVARHSDTVAAKMRAAPRVPFRWIHDREA